MLPNEQPPGCYLSRKVFIMYPDRLALGRVLGRVSFPHAGHRYAAPAQSLYEMRGPLILPRRIPVKPGSQRVRTMARLQACRPLMMSFYDKFTNMQAASSTLKASRATFLPTFYVFLHRLLFCAPGLR